MPRRGRSPMASRPPPRAPAAAPSRPMSTAPSRPMSTAPAYHPPAAPMAPGAAAPRQPGMFAQMATTAAGVAVGSAVGHTIGHAMTGGSGGGYQAQDTGANAPPAQVQSQPQQQAYNPCQRELQQFLDCAQGQSDVSLCAGFNEALRQCKQQYGPMQQA